MFKEKEEDESGFSARHKKETQPVLLHFILRRKKLRSQKTWKEMTGK